MLQAIMVGLLIGPVHGVAIIRLPIFAAQLAPLKIILRQCCSPPYQQKRLLGESSEAPFSITLECEAGAMSSTHPTTQVANVAMGFLVNQPAAVAAARRLGLTTTGGGLTWLLDTHYGEKGVASGVGIRIYDERGAPLNLLPDKTSTERAMPVAGMGIRSSRYKPAKRSWFGGNLAR